VVVEALAEIQAQGSTVLLVEEKTTYALRLANEVGLLSQGVLRWVRKSADVGAEEVAAAYLGVAAP
jgi:ABC-type branched-subunit amino acid transport system ATPase component